ncbi:MAG: methionine ABC transporter ATP-binding protein [Sulfurospirillaceae bacterium]|nr:methionine ABC transporter ATP-binding protein [Sulfurospirillaceae bacterium]MCK9545640.1 methionine ABC transporter ATP-binding protein [Sulfurospirillaceae bacterium]MDY0238089.1 methionine ABC transporter ATP-binding protein [Campylobacterales bacterium]NLN00075.1 methionine ABC transporter ATP-binding protein [Campylobacteraceae bacterium]
MINIKDLNKSFHSLPVLKGINLEINEGEIFAIVGHSGAGKSTLLRCINGLEGFDSGEVEVFGYKLSNISSKELRSLRKKMGMIFQNFALASQKTVFQNIALPLQIHGFSKEESKKRVDELLELVGLSDKALVYPNTLSGGQKQRVAIARALALSPKVLLSDEATSALDPKTTNDVLELLRTINKELGITIVVVTHEMDVVKKIASRALLLEDGNILGEGDVKDLFLNPNSNMKKFLGEEEYLPQSGENIKLYFPKSVAKERFITKMARELDIDFSIVWGKLERLGDDVLGHLVINIEHKDEKIAIEYLSKSSVNWERV